MMTNRNRKRGRPPKFVEDPNGRPIVGLSYNKSTDSYYATYSKPRVWFGSDFGQALFNFRRYHNQQAIEQPYVEIHTPFSPDETETRVVKWSELCGDPPVIAAAYAGDSALLPESMFLETVRNFILKDPITAARKIGIPELSRLEDLPPLEQPLSLDMDWPGYVPSRKSESMFNESEDDKNGSDDDESWPAPKMSDEEYDKQMRELYSVELQNDIYNSSMGFNAMKNGKLTLTGHLCNILYQDKPLEMCEILDELWKAGWNPTDHHDERIVKMRLRKSDLFYASSNGWYTYQLRFHRNKKTEIYMTLLSKHTRI